VQTGQSKGTDRNSCASVGCVPGGKTPAGALLFRSTRITAPAAREAGVRIALDSFELPALVANHPYIVEGAGGAMVPLKRAGLDVGIDASSRHFL